MTRTLQKWVPSSAKHGSVTHLIDVEKVSIRSSTKEIRDLTRVGVNVFVVGRYVYACRVLLNELDHFVHIGQGQVVSVQKALGRSVRVF